MYSLQHRADAGYVRPAGRRGAEPQDGAVGDGGCVRAVDHCGVDGWVVHCYAVAVEVFDEGVCGAFGAEVDGCSEDALGEG